MLSSIKRILIALTLITMAAIAGLYFYSKNHTYTNASSEIGNTAGNIYNGGLFCEQGKKIYFSNDFDNGSLYCTDPLLTNFKKLSEDTTVYINADANYIYYVRANDSTENSSDYFFKFNNNGVYRIKHNGSGIKAFTGNPSAYLTLKGNSIYFDSYDVNSNFNLYRYNLDGTKDRLQVQNKVIPAMIDDTLIYFTDNADDYSIDSAELTAYSTKTLFKGSYKYPIFQGNYIYYIDPSNQKLYRMNSDGTNPTALSNKKCSTYNITVSGQYLYYQIDDGKTHGIYRINLETMDKETLKKGKYKQINVTSDYVFFKDYDNTNTYVIAADGTSKPTIFVPINAADMTPTAIPSAAPSATPTVAPTATPVPTT